MSTSTTPPSVATSSSSSKKPTFVPMTNARSLLRPKKSTIDYNEPRLPSSTLSSSLSNDNAPLDAPPKVTSAAAKTTGSQAGALSEKAIPAAPGASSVFSFDNHTLESAQYAVSKDENKAKTSATTTSSGGSRAKSSASTVVDPHGGQYTILRIKRKRNEEPLDMLVVQELLSGSSGGKKAKTLDDHADNEVANALAGDSSQTLSKDPSSSKAPPTAAVFRFAATVNEASFKDPTQSIQLRDRITQIQNDPSSAASALTASTTTSTSSSSSSSSSRPRSRLADRPDRRSIIGGGASTPTKERRDEMAQTMQSEAKMARYRVIQKNRSSMLLSGGDGTGNSREKGEGASSTQSPPEVKSASEVEAEAALTQMFTMFDAVKEEMVKSKEQLKREAEESDIMCNLMPLVKEYLSISEKEPSLVSESKDNKEPRASFSRLDRLLAETGQDIEDENDNDEDDDEYVYDIYYRDMNADQHQASTSGHRTVGSLLWYEDDGEENFILDEDSSGDDYEDSDSNAEDYYQNDYPEEEESDEYAYELSDTDDDEYMY